MRSKDAYGLGLCVVQDAFYNIDSTQETTNGGYPSITIKISNQTVEGDSNISVPVATPFGFISMPADGTYALTMNLQAGTISPIVISQVPAYANLYPISGLVSGESALYSFSTAVTTSYALQANLTGLHARLSNTIGNNIATMLYGENIVKTLIDIITYIDSLSTWLTNFQSGYNSGTVPYSPTIPPTTTIDGDSTGLQAGKGYVNNTGEPM